MYKLTNTEKAYIAGIIDGEGTITLTRRRKNETPSPSISVSNTNIDLIDWLKSKLGGGITKKTKERPWHKQGYVWKIVLAGKCLDLLINIKPYLIVKKCHANLLLSDYKKTTKRNGKYSEEELNSKIELINKIRVLNK